MMDMHSKTLIRISDCLRILFSIMILSTLAGCGVYSFTGSGIGGIETIAIEPFDNQTAEFGVREDLTDTILDRLLKDRTLTVADRSSADAVLYGNIVSIDDRPLSFDEQETVSEFEIKISVSFVLKLPDKSEPIWQGQITGTGSYPYQTGGADEREQGIEKALDRIAQDLLNKLTSDW